LAKIVWSNQGDAIVGDAETALFIGLAIVAYLDVLGQDGAGIDDRLANLAVTTDYHVRHYHRIFND